MNILNACSCPLLEEYNPSTAPIPVEAIVLLSLLRCNIGHCTIAGGSVVAEMLYQSKKCDNCLATCPALQRLLKNMNRNDIDFFVPLNPSDLQRFYGLPLKDEGTFWSLFVNKVLPIFNAFCKIHLGKDDLVVVSRNCNSYNENYNWKGIHEVIDLQFGCDLEHNNPATKFQLVILDSFPHSTYQSWNEHAVANFDIDIVKNYVEIGANLRPTVHFIEMGSHHSLNTGSFTYTILPGAVFLTGLARIQKYLKRGFCMRMLSFDPRVTLSFRKYWMGSLHSLFAHFWATRKLAVALQQNNRTDTDDGILHDFAANQQIGMLIQEFVWKSPGQEVIRTIHHNQFHIEKLRLQE